MWNLLAYLCCFFYIFIKNISAVPIYCNKYVLKIMKFVNMLAVIPETRHVRNKFLKIPNESPIINKYCFLKVFVWITYAYCIGKKHKPHYFVIVIINYNMTSFKRFESKPVVKIIYTNTHCIIYDVIDHL